MTYRPTFGELIETLKRAAGALRDDGITFVLGGGIASAAQGGPESDHDVDLLLRPQDADRALAVLDEAGFRPERPPEGWLYKAWDGDVFVDLIFQTAEGDVTRGSVRAGDRHGGLCRPHARARTRGPARLEAARAGRDDARLQADPGDRPGAAGAGGLAERARADERVAVCDGVLHAHRGARDRSEEEPAPR